MEKILFINGISPYLYALAVFLNHDKDYGKVWLTCLGVFLVQLLATIIISIVCKDKKELARVTLINKLIQIPYFVLFFIFSVLFVFFGTFFFGIGILFLPVFIMIDFGVFLSTLIPEEICTMNLISKGRLSGKNALEYLIFNAIYIADIFLEFSIYNEYKKI